MSIAIFEKLRQTIIIQPRPKPEAKVETTQPFVPRAGTPRKEWFEWYRETYLKSKHWQQVREHCLKRDRNRCRLCNNKSCASVPLQVHHSDYSFLYKELLNDFCVITLCETCHKAHHAAKQRIAKKRANF
jgi:hypothetical protein